MMPGSKLKNLINKITYIILIFGLFLISCQLGTDEGCLCTDEFVTITVVVVDSLMAPLDSVSVQTVNKETDEVIQVHGERFSFTTGNYVVIDDSHIKKLSVIPAFFIFEGQKGQLSFKTDFVFNTDLCHCHVHKVAGPDTIIAR